MPDDLCECGKPLTHLDAPEDSKEWGCLVPDPAKFMAEHKRDRSNHTPHRTVRVADDVWKPAVALAAERGETVTGVVTEALRRYVKRSAR